MISIRGTKWEKNAVKRKKNALGEENVYGH